MSELDVCRRLHVFFTYDLGALPLVWHFSSCSVSKVSWTRRGWVQVSSMEMLRWGSCDSREAPPHRINSSVIARDRGPTLTSAHRPTQTGRPLQVSDMSSTQAVTGLLLNKVFLLASVCPWSPFSSPFSSHISAPGVFWYVGHFSLRSHTPWITWMSGHGDHCNPFAPTSGRGNPSVWTRWDHKEEESLSSKNGFSVTYQTGTSQGLCVWAALLLFYLCTFSFWF